MAYRSIYAHQLAIDITNHNVVMPILRAFRASQSAPLKGILGIGVDADDIIRYRDTLIDFQIRGELQTLSQHKMREQVLRQLETILNEPSDHGLGSRISSLWDSWSELSNTPESIAARQVFEQKTTTLTSTMNHIYQQLTDIRINLDRQVNFAVVEVNKITDQLATLNYQVRGLIAGGGEPNDLLDEQDRLIERLSHLADIRVFRPDNGTTTVTLGGRALVLNEQQFKLTTVRNQNNDNLGDAVWDDDNALVRIANGQLRGLLNSRDIVVKDKIMGLETIATTLRNEANNLH